MDGAAPAAIGPAGSLLVIENAPASPEYGQTLRLVGQTLSVTLVGHGENGARLELPSGQIINALGSLPFPEHTKLQVRASVQDGAIVLQTLEALPPTPSALLAPLIYGEAADLLRRLQAKDLPEALAPLANLFASLFASNEARLQKSIESLPVPTQQLLSALLGLKDGSAAQILHSLIENFEPIESLLDKQIINTSVQNIFGQSKEINEQKMNPSINISINQLRELIVQYFGQHAEENAITDVKTIEPLLESIKKILSYRPTEFQNSVTQKQSDNGGALSNFEKLLYAIRSLPNDASRHLSKALFGNMDSDPEAIAKTMISKIDSAYKYPDRTAGEENLGGVNQVATKDASAAIHRPVPPDAQLQTASQRLLQAVIALPVLIRREISSALLGVAEADPKTIADFLAQKADMANFGKTVIAALEKAPPDMLRIIAQAQAEAGQKPPIAQAGQLANSEAPFAASDAGADFNKLANAPHGEANRAATAPGGQRVPAGGAPPAEANRAAAALGSPRPPVGEALPTEASKAASISGRPQPSAGEVPTPEANRAALVSGSPRPPAGEAPPVEANKLAHALETMPAAVRRALASATVGLADAEPSAIARFLVRQGAALNLGQDNNSIINSMVESAPPLARQVLALLANLPLNAPAREIADAIANGDKEIFIAAKALAAGGEPVLSKHSARLDKDDAPAKKNDEASPMSVSRLKYLLRFEGLNASHSFPAEDSNAISNWFRSIVDLLIMIKSEKFESGLGKPTSVLQGDSGHKPAAHENAVGSSAAHSAETSPENPPTWKSWLKGTINALLDPHVSPKEALFHALATRENVNYLELPLPWAQGRNLEIWVENGNEDGSGRNESNKKTFRVLLALKFSAIGETRVGLESSSKKLNINIWAENPQSIEKELAQMQNELTAFGFEANISINNLVSGPDGIVPTIKSQIVSPSLHVLG